MSPAAFLILSWVAATAAALFAMEADASGSTLLMAIAALCGVIFALGQCLAFSLAVGREHDRVIALLRGVARPANDEGAR